MPGPRVLSVLLDVPLPATTGLHLRMLANLRLVRELGCESAALVFRTAERPAIPRELERLCDLVLDGGPRREYGTLPPATRLAHRVRMLAAAARGGASSRYPFSMPYDEVGAGDRVLETAMGLAVDTVVLPTTIIHYAPRLAAQGIRVIGDAADVLADLAGRLLRTQWARTPLRTPGLIANLLACRAQERRFLPTCAEIWVSTEAERARLRILAPAARIVVAGNTLDAAAIAPAEPPDHGPVGLIGNYSLVASRQAAEFLARRVFPRVRRSVPDARLVLAGAGLGPEVARALTREGGVEVVGHVPDAVAFVASCAVMAQPIRMVAGLPLKLVEALACGRPVVASPELVAGLPLVEGEDVLVAATPEAWSRALVGLLRDAGARSRMGRRARAAFEAQFSFQASLARARCESGLAADAPR